MRVLYELCDILEDELKEIVRAGEMSANMLDNTYKVVDVIKDIKTIEAMENADYGSSYEGSNEGGSGRRGRSYEGGSGRPYYSYDDEEYSMRRGRSRGEQRSRDSYERSGRYSRADEKEKLMEKMDEIQRKIETM